MDKFIKLTRTADGKAVFVAVSHIAAAYPNFLCDDRTVIQFAGDENNYLEVKESAESVMNLIHLNSLEID